MKLPNRAYGVLLLLWAAGVRVDSATPRQIGVDAEPSITAEPVRVRYPRIYAAEHVVRDMLSRMMGMPVPTMEP